MSNQLIFGYLVLLCVGCNSQTVAQSHASSEPHPYVILEHRVIPAKEVGVQRDEYTVQHGDTILKVMYFDSQITGDTVFSVTTRFHYHNYAENPDLTQIPEVGTRIRECLLSKTPMSDGSPSIAVQPTSEPCMIRLGDTLRYLPTPNGPPSYVGFDMNSERLQ
jgi:hypothetical protein